MDDRELDALIAEKVMGFHRVVDDTKDADGVRYGNDVLLPPGETLESLEFFLPRKGPMALTYFVHARYSTNAAAALLVIANMRKRGFGFSCTDLTLDSGQEWWSCHFDDITPPGNTSYSAQGKSFPEAVCLAARKAVAGEKSNAAS